MSVTPASSAAWIVASAVASSGRPLMDRYIPPSPTADTVGPPAPSLRACICNPSTRPASYTGAILSAAAGGEHAGGGTQSLRRRAHRIPGRPGRRSPFLWVPHPPARASPRGDRRDGRLPRRGVRGPERALPLAVEAGKRATARPHAPRRRLGDRSFEAGAARPALHLG